MFHIKASDAPQFDLPGLSVTGLASPSRGAHETCVWRFTVAPRAEGATHQVDREEIFVVVAGRGRAVIAGAPFELSSGDALVVPAHTPFSIANPGDAPFVAIAVLPVGGRAALSSGDPFVPPWAK